MTQITEEQASKVEKVGRQDAEKFADDVTTSQMRQVYNAVKQAESQYRADGDLDGAVRRLKLLKPKLAYLTARDQSVAPFKNKTIGLIDKILEGRACGKLEMFFKIMEAYVGYHKYFSEDGMPEINTQPRQIDDSRIDETADDRAQTYVNDGVTTSQLRQIYSDINRAKGEFQHHTESEAKKTLYLLLPNLSYIAGRNDEMTRVVQDVRGWIHYAVEGDKKELAEFFELIEAIVAYHKYHETMEESNQ